MKNKSLQGKWCIVTKLLYFSTSSKYLCTCLLALLWGLSSLITEFKRVSEGLRIRPFKNHTLNQLFLKSFKYACTSGYDWASVTHWDTHPSFFICFSFSLCFFFFNMKSKIPKELLSCSFFLTYQIDQTVKWQHLINIVWTKHGQIFKELLSFLCVTIPE